MFIAKYPDGKVILEKDMVWDNVPEGMNMVELTLPIPVSYIDSETKEQKAAPARTVSLSGCEKYFFYNEAVSNIGCNSTGGVEGKLVAKAIGGILGDSVIEIRVDAGGFTTVRHYKLNQLVHTGIKVGA
jgi:hypothetical protein